MVPKTLVIGGRSFCGKAFLQAYRKFHPNILGTHYKDSTCFLDLNDPKLDHLPIFCGDYQYALITAGKTGLADCEKEIGLKFRCNVEGLTELIKQLISYKIIPLFFSSDYVFDGFNGNYDENSQTCPINEYGKQKEEMEKRILDLCQGECLIIRVSKVYGMEPHDGSLIDQIVTPLIHNQKIQSAYDQIFCPIYLEDVVKAVIALQKNNARGLYHLCGTETWSRLELALAIAKILHISPHCVERISLDDLERPYRLPKKLSMKCEKFLSVTQMELTPLSLAIQKIPAFFLETCEYAFRSPLVL